MRIRDKKLNNWMKKKAVYSSTLCEREGRKKREKDRKKETRERQKDRKTEKEREKRR